MCEDLEFLRIEYWGKIKFLVFRNNNGNIIKEKVQNFLLNEENINIFETEEKAEWEIDY